MTSDSEFELDRVPGVGPTFLITLLFGPLGIVPAVVHSTIAKWDRRPTGNYWVAFIAALAVWLLIGILIMVAVYDDSYDSY